MVSGLRPSSMGEELGGGVALGLAGGVGMASYAAASSAWRSAFVGSGHWSRDVFSFSRITTTASEVMSRLLQTRHCAMCLT